MDGKGAIHVKFDLPSPVIQAIDRLENRGYAAYVVGGCVRDFILGVTPHDYDICTAASPEEMKMIFRDERTIETGLKHGTLTVLLADMPLEITTFRQDGEYLDGRHPASVSFTRAVEDDLSRRDFTINAMAYSPSRGLCDPFHGREDCALGIIRCVGEAERRFSEDGLRILRALRFSARLSFPIEEGTARALRRLKNNLQKISRERIASELTGILQGRDCASILAAYGDVLAASLPELSFMDDEAWRRAGGLIPYCPADGMIRLAALLRNCHPSGIAENCARQARLIIQGLKMPVKMMDGAEQLVLHQQDAVTLENIQEMLWRLQPEGLSRLLQMKKAMALYEGQPGAEGRFLALEEKMQGLIRSDCCYRLGQLSVKGQDLAAQGLRGPAIGAMLEELMLQVVRGKIPNERERLMDYIRSNTSRLAE